MSNTTLIAMALVTIAGALVSVQAPMNAALGRGIGSPIAAATVSFAVGLVLLVAITWVLGQGNALGRIGAVSPWLLLGGSMGALFVFASLWAVPILGVVTTTALVIMGQLVAAMALDHFGAFGLVARDISLTRLGAVVLVAGGAILSRF